MDKRITELKKQIFDLTVAAQDRPAEPQKEYIYVSRSSKEPANKEPESNRKSSDSKLIPAGVDSLADTAIQFANDVSARTAQGSTTAQKDAIRKSLTRRVSFPMRVEDVQIESRGKKKSSARITLSSAQGYCKVECYVEGNLGLILNMNKGSGGNLHGRLIAKDAVTLTDIEIWAGGGKLESKKSVAIQVCQGPSKSWHTISTK